MVVLALPIGWFPTVLRCEASSGVGTLAERFSLDRSGSQIEKFIDFGSYYKSYQYIIINSLSRIGLRYTKGGAPYISPLDGSAWELCRRSWRLYRVNKVFMKMDYNVNRPVTRCSWVGEWDTLHISIEMTRSFSTSPVGRNMNLVARTRLWVQNGDIKATRFRFPYRESFHWPYHQGHLLPCLLYLR
jgi:hypothetical protein